MLLIKILPSTLLHLNYSVSNYLSKWITDCVLYLLRIVVQIITIYSSCAIIIHPLLSCNSNVLLLSKHAHNQNIVIYSSPFWLFCFHIYLKMNHLILVLVKNCGPNIHNLPGSIPKNLIDVQIYGIAQPRIEAVIGIRVV